MKYNTKRKQETGKNYDGGIIPYSILICGCHENPKEHKKRLKNFLEQAESEKLNKLEEETAK